MSALHLKQFVEGNENYRVVLGTSHHMQIVAMAIKDNIPKEVHDDNEQFIYIVSGVAHIKVDNNLYELSEGKSITIPQGAEHEVINKTPNGVLKLYTIYSPPHHDPNTVSIDK